MKYGIPFKSTASILTIIDKGKIVSVLN